MNVLFIILFCVQLLGMLYKLYQNVEVGVAINVQPKFNIRRKENERLGRRKRKKDGMKSESKEDHHLYILSMNEETWMIRG